MTSNNPKSRWRIKPTKRCNMTSYYLTEMGGVTKHRQKERAQVTVVVMKSASPCELCRVFRVVSVSVFRKAATCLRSAGSRISCVTDEFWRLCGPSHHPTTTGRDGSSRAERRSVTEGNVRIIGKNNIQNFAGFQGRQLLAESMPPLQDKDRNGEEL